MPARAAAPGGMLGDIAEALARSGLILRGSFDFQAGEDAPAMGDGRPAQAVVLVGAAGAACWRHFEAWRAERPANLSDPLDTWSREVIGAVAQSFGAAALSPSDRPYRPFQQWAMRAEGLRPSPLGILMHPRYGLWHAYRGALLFDHRIPTGEVVAGAHPCDTCDDKPCLHICPAGAHTLEGFAYGACLAHVRSMSGKPCRSDGCFSRNACPVGAAFRYPPAVQAFHMAAFAGPAAS